MKQPRLAKALTAAMKRKGIKNNQELALALGLDPKQRPAIYHWREGHNAPIPATAAKLGQVLDLDIEHYIDRSPRETKRVAKLRMGPAQRALTLAAQANGSTPVIMSPAPPVSDVFVFRARSDGTIGVKLDTVLPYARGVQLINALLGFGLVIGAEDDRETRDVAVDR